MLTVMLLTAALSAQFHGTELEALEAEIAQLENHRARLGGFANNSKRDEVDRRLDLLKRVHERAATVVMTQVGFCMQQVGNAPVQVGAPAQAQLAAAEQLRIQCLASARGIVARVRRAEELRDRLNRGNWTFSNHGEREAIRKELELLDRTLGL